MERDYLCAGIDLGTCFSCVYVYKKGSFVPVPIDGSVTVPSYISYANGQFHFGKSAKVLASRYPENTFSIVDDLSNSKYPSLTLSSGEEKKKAHDIVGNNIKLRIKRQQTIFFMTYPL